MAYNSFFPAGYQPAQFLYPQVGTQMSQAQIAQPQMQSAPQSGIIWVQGEAGAKSYMVAPNQSVQLWDSESQTIYLKSADASGMPSIKVLDYTIREANKTPTNPVSVATDDRSPMFATKDEMKGVLEQITALRDRVDNLTRKRRRDDDDE